MILKLNKTFLAVSSALILGGAPYSAAFAAEEQGEQESDSSEKGEVVVIRGIRDSLKRNLADKRDANSVVEVITAEDIGKFPDKNIAESLQRVPGVTINRGFAGEGNEVSIRGVDPELTQTLVNGQFIASTNWFSLSFNKRSFNMDLMPSELVESVVVHKSPTAEIDEGGVGGTVILNTRKPLDLDPATVYASLELMKNSLSSDNGTSANGLFSWKNNNENFGILAAYSKAETVGIGNKAENYWEEAWSASGISQFRQDRERDTYDINAQFQPTDRLSMGVHYFKTKLDATNTNQNFLVFGGCCDTASGQSDFSSDSDYSVTSPTTGIPMRGTLEGGSGNPGWAGWLLAQDVNSRRPELTSDMLDFTFNYDGEGYRLKGSIGSTGAKGGNGGNVNSLWGLDDDDSRWISNGGDLSVDFDFTLQEGMYVNVNGLSMADPTWQTNRAVSISEVTLDDEEDWFQFDAEADVEWGPFHTIKAGVKMRDHVFGKAQYNYTVDSGALFGADDTANAYFGGVINLDGGVLASGSDTSIAGISSSFDAAARANITGSEYMYAAYGQVTEDIFATYVQLDFSGDYVRGNVGVRYASTDVKGSTYADGTDPNSLFSRKASYSDVMPSFNLAYNVSDDKIIRTSAAKVISRPAYGTVNPALSGINPTANTASSGNVAIEPFRANQFDVGFEWYISDNDYFGAALFYKDIESFVKTGAIQELVYEPNGDQNAPNDLELYTLTVPIQGDSGSVHGVELNYQRTFGNFGFLANATISSSEGKTDDGDTFDLPGNSDLSYNLTGFYQVEKFEGRMTYTYRDKYLAEGTGIGGASDVFSDQGYLDLSLTYHITDNFDISFQGVNLTEEKTVQGHGAGSLGTSRVTTANGARYFLKGSVRF